ncbi:MAG: NACHT domain-containing protein, partial [bacterium]|nr:NACHT domain-containing protein [bacterium]
MPIEWVVLIAGAAISALTGPPLADAYAQARNKVRDALSEGGPLAKPLSRALEEACRAFIRSLEGAFHVDPQTEAQLREMMEDEAFVNALAELPFVPFRRIDTRRCRELFVKMGPQGADEGDFDAAWHFLGRRFRAEAAASEPLKNLLDLSAEVVREERDEELGKNVARLVAFVERLEGASEAPVVRDDEPAIRHYRAVLYERYRYADTRGLFMREKEGPGEGIELKDVFVETLLQRVPEGRKKGRAEKPREPGEGEWDDLPAEESASTDEAPQPIAEVLRRERLAVVLGAPGSGKSTLMRCLSMALCRPEATVELLDPGLAPETVPILFELKEFASALLEKPNRQLDRFLMERRREELPGIEELLSGGRALVLLDGLDEVFDEAHRRWVSDEVWRLATRFPQARFVLTSRPHGYQAAPLPGPVPRWRVVPFDDERIGGFFEGWFQALAREGVEVGAQESPEERAAALTADVLARPRIREMAQNPMLCTLIVLVHRSRTGQL